MDFDLSVERWNKIWALHEELNRFAGRDELLALFADEETWQLKNTLRPSSNRMSIPAELSRQFSAIALTDTKSYTFDNLITYNPYHLAYY